MRSPIKWFGGKGLAANWLLPLFPPHKQYLEPFAGAASMFFAKKPAKVETLNDLDGDLINFFRVLADPELFREFQRRVQALPVSRQLLAECRADLANASLNPVHRAVCAFVVWRQSFATVSTGFAITVERNQGTLAWAHTIERLPEVHERLRTVVIENKPALWCLGTYDGPDYLAYVDPPYVAATRRSGGYRHEMDTNDHDELVEALLAYRGAVVLSGYDTPIYVPLDAAGWTRTEHDVACYAAGRTKASGLQGDQACDADQRRTEVVWRNPECMRRISARDLPLFAQGDTPQDPILDSRLSSHFTVK